MIDATTQAVKSCKVVVDDNVKSVCRLFDYQFDGTSTFNVPRITPPSDWSIGLIVGPSGSGKSSALQHFGVPVAPTWDPEKAIVSHFGSIEDAHERLSAVGLNSIPSWVRPFHVLSTGEQFRANMSRLLDHGAVIDEFTSVVDRNVARSASVAIRRYCNTKGLKRIVFATCHYDVAEWLQPDWVFDTADHRMMVGRSQRRPTISIDIVPTTADRWSTFSKHHYLNESINTSARCWLALWGDVAVGFSSALAFPNGNFKNAWREHRTVVLPDYQGLGIGPRLSDAVASIFVAEGCRYFSKTAHPRLGAYRNSSTSWRPTSKNGRARSDYTTTKTKTKEDGHKMIHATRPCFSHEYVGTALKTVELSERQGEP
jgi:GNAT superfamily N-acetyltransferase